MSNEALRQVIKEWEELSSFDDWTPDEFEYASMPLCGKYRWNFPNRCAGCPVFERTQDKCCENNSYGKALNFIYDCLNRRVGMFESEPLMDWERAAFRAMAVDFSGLLEAVANGAPLPPPNDTL